MRALIKYTTDESEITMLSELCSREGIKKYSDFITNEFLTLLELLKKFKSCNPPIALLLEHLPKLQPRPYSISSSPIVLPKFDSEETINTELKIVYTLEVLPNSYLGVCTGWLGKKLYCLLNNTEQIGEGLVVPIYLRRTNHFRLPEEKTVNIIMIAAGTGVAPFMGFLTHRWIQLKKFIKKRNTFGKIFLYFGCRYSDRDFIFENELKNFLDSKFLTKLYTSFSREENDVKYVQDNIKKNEMEFVELLDEETLIYVCGSVKMCKNVTETVVSCVNSVKNYKKLEGVEFISELKKNKKYIEDMWD